MPANKGEASADNFLGRVLATCKRIEPLVVVVGGIASLVIAFFAYQIDQEVRDANLREARTQRAHTMAVEMERLGSTLSKFSDFAYEVHGRTRLLPNGNPASSGGDEATRAKEARLYRRAHAAAAGSFVKRMTSVSPPTYGDLSLRDVQDVIEDIYGLMKCSGMRFAPSELEQIENYGFQRGQLDLAGGLERHCNAETAFMFLGEPLFRMFAQTRAMFICDKEIRKGAPYVQLFLHRYYNRAMPRPTSWTDSFTFLGGTERAESWTYAFLFRLGEDETEQETLCQLYHDAMPAPEEPGPISLARVLAIPLERTRTARSEQPGAVPERIGAPAN